MNTKFLLLFSLFIVILISSCSKDDDDDILPEFILSEYEIDVIDYFKDIALGFEFGNTSNITRKWNSEMKVFIGGEPSFELLAEFEKIRTEINELKTDGFNVTVVDDSLQSNYYIFFGSGTKYAEMFPDEANLVNSNWGLFYLLWNSQNQFYSGHMYVDIIRANSIEQKHLLREEFTQSLGFARDSQLYMESIFQSDWTTTIEYAPIDQDLIRLLYHPEMSVGLNELEVDNALREILSSE
ncbi:DUF2927 domain-containing protein [Cyclobacteriaceae bacterium]|jgi:hypothetical protein|nr:DUF2927 domain-containing protein [Cyclobacteriaceae bacterium]|tara:strand:+ start:103 stop:822 length:720 start_codon:yes stop_codon:yes gene_type:complete